jgi:CRP-like cAMP-binding protein
MGLVARMFFFSKNPLEKGKKKVERYARKGKLDKAILLLRDLCQTHPDQVELWDELATLAGRAGLVEVQIAARFASARLRPPAPEVWVELSTLAASSGFAEDALDARFRAADAFATRGECRAAIEACDAVLALAPGHRAAERIRQLMLSRLVRRELAATLGREPEGLLPPPLAEGGEREGNTITFIPGGLDPHHLAGASPGPGGLDGGEGREGTNLEWLSSVTPLPEGGRRLETGPAPDPDLAQFVLEPQLWPSVLDHRSLLFQGRAEDAASLVDAFAEPLHVAAGEIVCEQGLGGHLLYRLDSGLLSARRDRGGPQELGTLEAGCFFGDLGVLAGLPCTTSVLALEESELRVVSKQHLRERLAEKDHGVQDLFAAVSATCVEAAVALCPILARGPSSEPFRLAPGETTTFRPGDFLADQDRPGSLLALLSGVVEVTILSAGSEITLGYLCSSDIVGEIDPSPVSARAVGVVSAIVVPRSMLSELPAAARAEVETRRSIAKRVIPEALRTLERTMLGL